MPRRAPRVCSSPGCGRLIRGDTRRCPEHDEPRRPRRQLPRESAARRGYGRAWQKLRKRILRRDPVCRMCRQATSTEVDHVQPKSLGGTDHPTNLQGLCSPCHSRKTAAEDGGFGNPQRHREETP